MRNGIRNAAPRHFGHFRGAIVSAAVLAVSAFPISGQTVPATAPDGSKYLAGRLIDDARATLRQASVDPMVSAKEAAILLEFAQKLQAAADGTGADPHTLKMLAEAARVADDGALQKEALRKLIAADSGDLVAQVQYLDYLASDNQELEGRAKIYQSAFDSTALDPQIRSEMANRLAQIAQERGDTESEKDFYNKAVALNSMNLPALRGLARIAAADPKAIPENIAALVHLLSASPYQPDAWIELARLCENANLHDRAADFLDTALEQISLEGAQPPGPLYLEYGIELAIAGRRVESFTILNSLAKLPDAPFSALVFAQILAETDIPGTTSTAPASTSTRPEKDLVGERLQAALEDLAKQGAADNGNSHDVADAASVALVALPTSPSIPAWIETYSKLVPADDPTLARLSAWKQYRDGKLDEAKAALGKLADSDPIAQIGLAHILIDQHDKTGAAKILQDLWSGHPTGILALQVAQAARLADITLADTQWTKQIRDAIKLPNAVLFAHRQPREMVLMNATIRRASVGLGEPVSLTVRMTNPTDKPLPVGGNGVVLTTLGLAAIARGSTPINIGLYAVEDVQRVYRLEPHANLETTLRVDQGTLAQMFERNPVHSYILSISLATAPLAVGKEMGPGLGGQLLQVGDIERAGMPMSAQPDFLKLKQDIAQFTGDRQFIRIDAAGSLLMSLTPTATAAATASTQPDAQETAKQTVIEALLPLAGNADPLVRAMFIQALPPAKFSDALDQAAKALGNDSDALVRVLWGARQAAVAALPGERGAGALPTLEEKAGGEKDPTVKAWMDLLVGQVKASQAATPPVTAPASSTAPAN